MGRSALVDEANDVLGLAHGFVGNRAGAARAIGEGHVARDDEASRPTDDLNRLVDHIGYLERQGVTVFNFAIPAVGSVEAYLDYAQWFIEEVKPRVG